MSKRLSPRIPFGNKSILAATAIIVLSLILILPLAEAGGADIPLRASVNQEGRDCSQSGTTTFQTQFMVENRAPWTQIIPISSRDLISNNFIVNQISFVDSQPSQSIGAVPVTYTLSASGDTATWAITSTASWVATRWNPIVLPGETTAVLYLGWVCNSTDNLGMHRVQVTISGTFQGQPAALTTEFMYRVVP